MERDSFVFYRSFAEAIEELDEDLRLKCFDAIVAYGIHGKETKLDGIPKLIFTMAKPQLDANNKKYVNGKKGGKYGKMGGRPKGKGVNDKNPSGDIEENPIGVINKTPNVNVNDNENVNENEKEKGNNYQLIADMYNNTCVSLPKVSKLSDQRKKAIAARLRKYSVEDLKKAFQMAEESDFLKGSNNRNWTANFDWLMNDTNLAKVLDGNYKNKGSKIEIDQGFRDFMSAHEVVNFFKEG